MSNRIENIFISRPNKGNIETEAEIPNNPKKAGNKPTKQPGHAPPKSPVKTPPIVKPPSLTLSCLIFIKIKFMFKATKKAIRTVKNTKKKPKLGFFNKV